MSLRKTDREARRLLVEIVLLGRRPATGECDYRILLRTYTGKQLISGTRKNEKGCAKRNLSGPNCQAVYSEVVSASAAVSEPG